MSTLSQLPLELIVLIIKCTDSESNSATNWCLATEGSTLLHKEALAHRWRDTYIGGCDFMAAPWEYEDLETEAEHEIVECGKLAKANRDPQSKLSQAIRAASHIRRLYLDLRPRGLEQPYKYPDGYEGLEHTYDTADHSARSLLTSSTGLEALTLDGCVTDRILESVSGCESLTVRVHLTDDGFRRPREHRYNPSTGQPLSWRLQLPALTDFTLNELTFKEASPLANFVEFLTSLKRLYIKVRFQFDGMREEYFGTEPRGPMASLLDYVPPGEETPVRGNLLCKLPSSLKSLTLIDNYFLGEFGPSILPPPIEIALSAISLTSLTTQLDHYASTPGLLAWMPQSRLHRLSMLVSNTADHPESLESTETINETIRLHAANLHEIQLTSALSTDSLFGSSFNATWTGKFAITELTLGLLDIQFGDGLPPIKTDSLFDALYGRGYPIIDGGTVKRWGDQLLRVRLESANLENLIVGRVFEPGNLSNTRILIVAPRGLDFDKHYPAPLDSFKAGKLALEIVKLAPLSLRYLSIGLDAFWIDYPPQSGSSDEKGTPRLRHYDDAYRENGAEMQKWFTEQDREFIDPESRLNAPRNGRTFEGDDPDYQLLVGWNYLVARKIDETGKEVGA